MDYRALNKITVADAFPLLKIDDLLDQLGKSRYFSTLDLKSGYWQIQVHPSSQAKTTFTTHKGLFEFRVMPFGLMNASAAFQRLMQQILSTSHQEGSPNFVAVYLDGILIFSETFTDHKNHIQQVLQKLEEVNLKLNPKKCHFGCQVVECLGHTYPHSSHQMGYNQTKENHSCQRICYSLGCKDSETVSGISIILLEVCPQ